MFRRIMAFGLFCLLVVLAVSCDDDCPTCPPPPTDPVSDYDVYLAGYPHSVYVYNTQTMVITDSLDPVDAGSVSNLTVSPDGQYLIVGYTYPTAGTLIYDLKTGDTIKTLSAGTGIEISNSGKYIAYSTDERTDFLDGKTFENLFSLPFTFEVGRFLLNESKFYCIVEHHYIHVYDLASQSLDTAILFMDNYGRTPELFSLQPDSTGQKFYFAAAYEPYVYYLLAYSLQLDSTTMSYRLIGPPLGDLRITPDGSQIIYSDPGNVFYEMFSSNYVFFFNPVTDAIISIVDAGRSIEGDGPPGFEPGVLAFTPDSRYTIVACAGGCPAFGMIDNIQHRFVNITYEKEQPYMWNFWTVSCQKLCN